MALRPSDSEIAAIIDVQTLAQWCGLSDVPPTNTNNQTPPPEAEMNILFAHLGCGPNDHFRSFAMVTAADWETDTKDIKVNGARPNFFFAESSICFMPRHDD